MEPAEFRQVCLAGDAETVGAGLAAGCDASEAKRKGMTPLMLAVWQHHAADVVEALLGAGADADEPGCRVLPRLTQPRAASSAIAPSATSATSATSARGAAIRMPQAQEPLRVIRRKR